MHISTHGLQHTTHTEVKAINLLTCVFGGGIDHEYTHMTNIYIILTFDNLIIIARMWSDTKRLSMVYAVNVWYIELITARKPHLFRTLIESCLKR